jgi:hypothetical protein
MLAVTTSIGEAALKWLPSSQMVKRRTKQGAKFHARSHLKIKHEVSPMIDHSLVAFPVPSRSSSQSSQLNAVFRTKRELPSHVLVQAARNQGTVFEMYKKSKKGGFIFCGKRTSRVERSELSGQKATLVSHQV